MTDVHDTKTRSYNMSRIRAKYIKTEMFRLKIFGMGYDTWLLIFSDYPDSHLIFCFK
jgi:G:T-mismatch repair DNA endonuclease (very short patch repair protein)